MAKIYNNRITTTAGFNFPAKAPLDDRAVVESYSDLNTLVTNNQTYEGMSVYVVEDKKAYRLIGTEWEPEGEGIVEPGAGANSIQQVGTGAQALSEASVALGYQGTAIGKAAFASGFSSNQPNNTPQAPNNALISDYIASLLADPQDEELIETRKAVIIAAWDAAHARRVDKTAEGYTGNSDTAGLFAIALGTGTHVEGENNIADYTSHAEGRRTKATGPRSHTEGTDTVATGSNSHAEGQDSVAKGQASHAEGFGTEAGTKDGSKGGEGAHSEGTYTKALAVGSHAEGVSSKATAAASHAEGESTEASGKASHAEGRGTIAARDYQHVQGQYNIKDEQGKYVHIIGWGSSDTQRSDIHRVDTYGNAWYKGKISADGDVVAGTVSLKSTNDKIAAVYVNPANGNSGGATMLGGKCENGTTYSHSLACGYKCIVSGSHSMVFGANLTAKSSQVAVGYKNNPDEVIAGKRAIFMVGDGYSTNRNAFTVSEDGDAKIRRDLYVGSTALTEAQLKKILKFINTIEE